MSRRDAWMPMYWGDYARDTGHLNAAGHGAYLMLIKHYWCTGSPLPDDDDELWRVACCDSKKEWLALRPRILRFFTSGEGVLRHKRIDLEIAKTIAVTSVKAEAGRLGAEKRWQKPTDDDGTSIADPSSANGTPMAGAMPVPSVCQWQNDAPSQSPLPSQSEEQRIPSLRSGVPRPGESDPDFNEFWAIYPRKDAKLDAEKAWKAARRIASAVDIIGGLRRYPFDEFSRRKLPAGWLREGRWQAEADTRPVTVAPSRRNGTVVDLVEELDLDLITPLDVQFPLEERERDQAERLAKRSGVAVQARVIDGRG